MKEAANPAKEMAASGICTSAAIGVGRGSTAYTANSIESENTAVVKSDVFLTKEPAMAERTYPSYWMYKDKRGEWRWSYEASNAKTIAVSSEGYIKRSDCERSIDIMKASHNSPVWYPSYLENAA